MIHISHLMYFLKFIGKASNDDVLGRESPPNQQSTSEQPAPSTVTVTATITRPSDDDVNNFPNTR